MTSPSPSPSSTKTRTEFHTNITHLYKKTHEPASPVSYLGQRYTSESESKGTYILLREQEQYLADSLAFLAQRREGPGFVSAVMVEHLQVVGPGSGMGMVVRLASNETPRKETVEGLKGVLGIAGEYAKTGRRRKTFFSRLFAQVLSLSRERLLWRLRSSHYPKRIWPPIKKNNNSNKRLLHESVDTLLTNLSHQHLSSGHEPLINQLRSFKDSLVALENCVSDAVTAALQAVVQQSWTLSTVNNSKSLETQLQDLGSTEALYQSRIVLDIDKISKYLEICRFLMRLARNDKTKSMFSNIRLEICVAPPATIPEGARIKCCVHGEVQLVLYYEQNPSKLPPRCIGSSKSACFLCDLFIREHGKYHLSHTHKRLYEKWTVPTSPNRALATKIETILRNMNAELLRLLKAKIPSRPSDNGPESRAHLLILPDGTFTVSPIASILSQPTLPASITASLVKIDPKALSSTLLLNTIAPTGTPCVSVHKLADLPLLLNITRSTKSSTVLTRNVAYIFDLEDVHSGQLQISKCTDEMGTRNVLRVNARDPTLDTILSLRDGKDERELTFCIHDGGSHELEVIVRWFAGAVDACE